MGDDKGAEHRDTLQGGRYTLLELIGEGGMAFVWRARDERLGVERAVKIIRGEGRAIKTRSRRLLAEAKAMARIKHPHIVAVHDVLEDEEAPAIVMDLIDGGTLEDQLTTSGPLPPRKACVWMLQVLGALHAGHQEGIVHRDVKPSNILLDTRGNALLADFGIALLADEDRHTRTGVTMGSVAYMAPEQRLDARAVQPNADVYAAGSTLFHLLTGATAVDLFTADASSPRWLDVPEPLQPVIFQATRLDPAARFPTAQAFAMALEAVIDDLDALTNDDASTWVAERRAAATANLADPDTGDTRPPPVLLGSMGGTLVAGADDTTEDRAGSPLWMLLALVGVVLVGVASWWVPSGDVPGAQAEGAPRVVEALPAVPVDVAEEDGAAQEGDQAPAPQADPPEAVPAVVAPAVVPEPARARPMPITAPKSSVAPTGSADAVDDDVVDGPVQGVWYGTSGVANLRLELKGPASALKGTYVTELPTGDDSRTVAGTFDASTGVLRLRSADRAGRPLELDLRLGSTGTEVSGNMVSGARTQTVAFAR